MAAGNAERACTRTARGPRLLPVVRNRAIGYTTTTARRFSLATARYRWHSGSRSLRATHHTCAVTNSLQHHRARSRPNRPPSGTTSSLNAPPPVFMSTSLRSAVCINCTLMTRLVRFLPTTPSCHPNHCTRTIHRVVCARIHTLLLYINHELYFISSAVIYLFHFPV